MRRNPPSNRRDADRVYDELRRKVLALNLNPGTILDEARIVEEMGTSRTPVREAVIRLVSEGLLRRDGRQIRVSTFEVSQLRAFFEAMTLISRAVNRMAASRRTAAQLALINDTMTAFEKNIAQGDEIRLSELNHAFHKAIGAAADSAFLQKAYEDLLVESLRLARQCFAGGEDPGSTRDKHLIRIVADHQEIYEAIKQRDIEAADRIAAHHSLLFRERLTRQILGPSTHALTISLKE